MTKRGVVGVVGGLACALLVGCGGNEAVAPGPKSPFPSRATLDAIASAPLADVPVRKVVSPPTWEVELGTETPGFTAAAVEGKWKERMADEARGPLAPELRCAAHELARVLAEHGLQRLVAARSPGRAQATKQLVLMLKQQPAKILAVGAVTPLPIDRKAERGRLEGPVQQVVQVHRPASLDLRTALANYPIIGFAALDMRATIVVGAAEGR